MSEGIGEDLKSIKAQLTKLDEAIRGNGKPGILMRLDRVERIQHLLFLFLGAAGIEAARFVWEALGK